MAGKLSEDIEKIPLTFKNLTAIASLIGAMIAGVFFIEQRYAKASDVEVMQQITPLKIKQEVTGLRKKDLEDKVFELELLLAENASKVQPIDKARLERYRKQLSIAESQYWQIERDLSQLESKKK